MTYSLLPPYVLACKRRVLNEASTVLRWVEVFHR
jgi:hypothetical protein